MSVSINTAAILVAVFLLFTSHHTFAQAKVRESAPVASVPSVSQAPVAQAPVASERAFDPSYQIQLLQDEIMLLRGLLEEQAFEIKRLKQQRLDDYLDLDKRLTAQESRKFAPQPTAPAPILPQLVPPVADNAAEKKLYNDAIDQLLDQQDYAAAKLSFEQYSQTYPEGVYAANVQYWLGQIFLTEGDNESAEKAFAQIVESYPEHQKAPDAQFKLAKIYFDKGDKDNAKALLDTLAAGDTEAARFAKSFLAENF